jgi:methylenetetrahydrofolate--tRNA-(uracil-5-)-methyltransferase
VHVIGAGLAGSEAAWQVAKSGVPVVLHEMRPTCMTEAHRTDGLAELVCSNSFRSDDAANNAVGLLHAEMRRLDSLIMRAADANQVPAGGALAVDRDGFSAAVTKALNDHPLIEIARGEVAGLPPAEWSNVIVATSEPLSNPSGTVRTNPCRPCDAIWSMLGVRAASSGVFPPSSASGSSAAPSGMMMAYFIGAHER